ncbi:hypothetical protein WD019_00640 [Fictibacillus sp. Mic-4]|uniref:hypothetical protein n=1 Tax=Fictibacillus sp. Mic-4 TaxID=3132826 RepID=UPI003CF28144
MSDQTKPENEGLEESPSSGDKTSELSQQAMNMQVANIFRKHGITKEHLKQISEEQVDELKNLLEQFKAQLDFLNQNQEKKKKGGRTRPRRRGR